MLPYMAYMDAMGMVEVFFFLFSVHLRSKLSYHMLFITHTIALLIKSWQTQQHNVAPQVASSVAIGGISTTVRAFQSFSTNFDVPFLRPKKNVPMTENVL